MKPTVNPAVGHCVRAVGDGTAKTVQAERCVIKEVTDVTGICRHGAEGVSAAGREGIQTDQKHVDQQGPGVTIRQKVHSAAQQAKSP